MSQSKGIDTETGMEDKEGEKKEDDPHTKQEQEAFTSGRGDVSSSSSSTPTETASADAEMSKKVPSEQPNLDLPFKKRQVPQTAQAQEVASASKSEDATTPEMAQAEDEADESDTDSDSLEYVVYDYFGSFYKGILLFEVQLTEKDVNERLLIPAEDAVDHFPPLQDYSKKSTAEIQVTDTKNDDWTMTISYYAVEHAFLVTNGWLDFVESHKLVPKDWVRVHLPEPRKHQVHFLIECVKGKREERPEFYEDRYLFKVELTETDVTYGRLMVPREELRTHFPEIDLPEARHKVERMRWTDEMGRDWMVKIMYSGGSSAYMVFDGWEKFVKEHALEAMDVVKFYSPLVTLNPRHALVKCEKRDKGEQDGKDG